MLSIKIILAAQIFFAQGFAQSLDPGIWKVKTEFKLDGIPLPTSDDEQCITPAEAQDAKATVTKELKRNNCIILTWKVAGKNLTAQIKCETPEIQAEGALRGTFSAKSYQLTGAASGTYQGIIPAKTTLKLNGNWISACKK